MKSFTLALILCLLSVHANSSEMVDSDKAFKQLKTLVGTWKRVGTNGGKFSIEYTLTANNSVLIEEWLYGTRVHSLTIYHQDKNDLLATHYCPQGNQPRLKLLSNSTEKAILFQFYDATNLKSLDDSHQHELEYHFSREGFELMRSEAYLQNGILEKSSLRLDKLNESFDTINN